MMSLPLTHASSRMGCNLLLFLAAHRLLSRELFLDTDEVLDE
jgi:hypothetical protein